MVIDTQLDSNADQCVFGDNVTVLKEDLENYAYITPFLRDLGNVPKVPICSVAVAYDCPNSFQTYILIFHQALVVPKMEHILLCPNQLRSNDVIINECPLQFVDPAQRNEYTHSIIVENLHIPLTLSGIASSFSTRRPTDQELADPERFPQIVMTSEARWEPQDTEYGRIEDNLRASLDVIRPRNERSISEVTLNAISPSLTMEGTIRKLDQIYSISSVKINKKGHVDASTLASKWFIGKEVAQRTILKTTQRGVRDFSSTSGTRRLKHMTYQLMYKHLKSSVYTDTLQAKEKSLDQNLYAQIYVTDFHWTKVYPMRSKSEAHLTLDQLHKDYGIFHTIIPDNAKELTQGEFKRKAQRAGSVIRPVEAYMHNQNRAEAAIREIRRMYRKAMRATNAPHVLWDHCIQLMAEIRSHTALDILQLQGDVPTAVLTGDTPDISHLCEFSWYDPVWYIDTNDPMQNKKLARYLGPSHDVGQAMASKIFLPNCQIIVRSSVIPLSVEDKNNPIVSKQLLEYDESIKRLLGSRAAGIPLDDDDFDPEEVAFIPYADDDRGEEPVVPDRDLFDDDTYHRFISAQVRMSVGGEWKEGTVIARKRDEDGNLIGKSNKNVVLDTSLYDVKFDDGLIEAVSANAIAENIYARIDEEGNVHELFEEIIDHKKMDDALSGDEGFIFVNGQKRMRKTTQGWKICVRWKDGSSSWFPLSAVKESNPVELAEYAIANKIAAEPAFTWWVPYTLKKKERIIAKIKTRYFRREQKFGIPLPKSVAEAYDLDKESGTTFWSDAIRKEVGGNIMPAIKILDEGKVAPVGYQKIPCHIVFDIKMDFSRKARYVAGGHVTEPPVTQTYASVVSRESVRIAFLIAALNDLEIMTADVQGAYLNAPCKEKVYTICGPEFGPELRGRIAIIVKALYGLKTSAFAWREHLAQTLVELGFKSCIADYDVWMRPCVKSNGDPFYEYLLVYTDDLLCISNNPREILNNLDQHYLLKPDSICIPTQYLGAQIGKYVLEDEPDRPRWYMSSEKYVKEAVRNVKEWMKAKKEIFKTRAPSVLPSGYRPELDVSDYCSDEDHDFYQQQIGVLRWMVELGRIDITCKVSMLAAFTSAPREGHVKAMLHIYSYLATHDRSKLVFDDSYTLVTDELVNDWSSFYPDAHEEIPSNVPEPRGRAVHMTVFVDADHAGDVTTRRSRTGVLIYINSAPIQWYSKRQNLIETSTFGSEFNAVKTAIELTKGIRYKLRMMGIALVGHAHLRVDNMSVVKNTSIPESQLKKKSNAIAYHFVREAVAAGIAKIGYETSKTNLADLLTKIQSGAERQRLVENVLF